MQTRPWVSEPRVYPQASGQTAPDRFRALDLPGRSSPDGFADAGLSECLTGISYPRDTSCQTSLRPAPGLAIIVARGGEGANGEETWDRVGKLAGGRREGDPMKAVAVLPGTANSVHLREIPEPR